MNINSNLFWNFITNYRLNRSLFPGGLRKSMQLNVSSSIHSHILENVQRTNREAEFTIIFLLRNMASNFCISPS